MWFWERLSGLADGFGDWMALGNEVGGQIPHFFIGLPVPTAT